MPLVRGVTHIATGPRLQGQRLRVVAISCTLVVGLLWLFNAVPVPRYTHAEGVVWMPDEALVRARASGFVVEFMASPGEVVSAGAPLVRSIDPVLAAQLRRVAARVGELRVAYAAEQQADRANARVEWEKLQQELANLTALEDRATDLVVRARTNGTFVVPQAGDQPGRYLHQGDMIGYVIGSAAPMIRVAVPQESVDTVRTAREQVRVLLGGRCGAGGGRAYRARGARRRLRPPWPTSW